MLMMVLGIVLFLSITAVALLGMTVTAGNVAVGLTTSTRILHTVDGVMEEIVDDARNDGTYQCTGTPTLVDSDAGYRAACTDLDPGDNERTMVFVAESISTHEVVGKARVRVIDNVNGVVSTGYMIEVCDWLIGASTAAQTPKACPA